MPIHDWRLVDAGIFQAFHVAWTVKLRQALEDGLLPPEYYARAEQPPNQGFEIPTHFQPSPQGTDSREMTSGGVDAARVPPKTRFHVRSEVDFLAAKANEVVIRHRSNDRVVALVDIVSPGNKSSRQGIRGFVEKAVLALRAGVHLLIVDLFSPGSYDPQGIHKAIWDELMKNDFMLPKDKPLTIAAYTRATFPEAFIEPVAVHDPLPDMPLFLTSGKYIPIPLEGTYGSAFDALPSQWRDALDSPRSSATR